MPGGETADRREQYTPTPQTDAQNRIPDTAGRYLLEAVRSGRADPEYRGRQRTPGDGRTDFSFSDSTVRRRYFGGRDRRSVTEHEGRRYDEGRGEPAHVLSQRRRGYLGGVRAGPVDEKEAIPHRIVSQNAHLNVVATVRDWTHLKEVAGTIESEHGSLELVGTTQTETIGFPLGGNKIKRNMSGKLSDKQLEVLETAYQMGYFRVPQEVTAEEIANELDISRSTLSERLRRVEHNFCELLFGPQR